MRTEVFEGIKNVDKDTWNKLTVGHPYAGWQWCLYGETVIEYPGYYALVWDGDTLAGGAIFAVMHDETVPTTNPLVLWFLRHYLMRRPLIVCRTAPVTDHSGLFLPDDPTLRAQVLQEIQRIGQEITKKHHGSFLLADYLLEEQLAYDWGEFMTLRDFTNVGMSLDVQWDTWDEFMADLKKSNKKTHKNVRHNMRYAEEEGIEVAIQHETPPIERVVELIITKMKHYGVPFESGDVRDIVRGLDLLDDDQVTWITAHHNGEMVGCELLLNDPENNICKPTLYGRSYDVEYVYFAMSYEDIRYAIEDLKAKTIVYDTEAYDFKRRLGMTPDRRNNLALYPNSRFERGLVSLLMRFMND